MQTVADTTAEDVSANNDNQTKKGLIGRILPIVLVAGALAAFFALGLHKYFTLDTLRDNRDALQAWVEASPLRAVAIFVLVYAGAVAISFPGASILTIFGGYLFGLAVGVPAIVFAATLGASIVFLASKTALGDILKQRASGFVKKMERGFHDDELNYMFILRIVPVFPFWAINIAAGVLGVSLRNFVIGTFFGIVPGTFVYASIGNAAGAAFDSGENVTLQGILFKPETLLPIAGLALLALLPVVLKRVNKQAAKLEEHAG
ncbi:MAG: TVP38/TMEM64 family protein [Pseudomonadota bacterium]